jgi:hypothetical protein
MTPEQKSIKIMIYRCSLVHVYYCKKGNHYGATARSYHEPDNEGFMREVCPAGCHDPIRGFWWSNQ